MRYMYSYVFLVGESISRVFFIIRHRFDPKSKMATLDQGEITTIYIKISQDHAINEFIC